MKKKVLFICVHNSARSQMAEAFLNLICPDHFEAHSAGLEPGTLNPLAVEAMREVGVDISGKKTQAVFDVFKNGQFSHTSLPYAMKAVRNVVRFFLESHTDSTGAFPTLPRSRALPKNNSKAREKFVIKFELVSKRGARRCAPWRRNRGRLAREPHCCGSLTSTVLI